MPLIIAPQVDEAPLSLPGAAPLGDSGLGSVAQGASQAAGAMREVADEMQRKRDATRVFEAESRLADEERKMREINQARRGTNAYGVTDDAASWWESEPAKLSAGLENDVQRELFAESVARRREISLNAFSNHEARESDAAANDAAEARKANAVNYGAANFDDPAAIEQARTDILGALSTQRAFQGLPPEAAEAAKLDALTKLHANVIENMADSNPQAANAYLDKQIAAGEIAGSVIDGLRSKIDTGRDLETAQQLADNIWARGLTREAALTAARKEAPLGQARQHTLSLLGQQYDEQDAAVNRQRADTLASARAAFDEPGGIRNLTAGQIDVLKKYYPGEYDRMTSTTPQEQVKTDWDTYELLLEHARKNPTNFRTETDLLLYATKLNQRDLDRLTKIQQDMRDNVPSSAMTMEQLLSNVTGDMDDEEKIAFRNSTWTAMEDEFKRLGRKLSGDEMRAIVDSQLIDVVVDRDILWDDTKPRFAMTPADYNDAWFSMDEASRTKIEAAFREKGYIAGPEPTVAEVKRMVDWYSMEYQVEE